MQTVPLTSFKKFLVLVPWSITLWATYPPAIVRLEKPASEKTSLILSTHQESNLDGRFDNKKRMSTCLFFTLIACCLGYATYDISPSWPDQNSYDYMNNTPPVLLLNATNAHQTNVTSSQPIITAMPTESRQEPESSYEELPLLQPISMVTRQHHRIPIMWYNENTGEEKMLNYTDLSPQEQKLYNALQRSAKEHEIGQNKMRSAQVLRRRNSTSHASAPKNDSREHHMKGDLKKNI